MITVKIIGGLGNQMFQYALARRLAMLNNQPFQLDLSGYSNYMLHDYYLHKFKIIENIASQEEITAIKKVGRSLLERIKPYNKRKIVQEKYCLFDPKVFKIKQKNVYLDGYWQNEKYFAEIKEILFSEFALKDGLGVEARKIAELINSSNSVSLHIRRGDYLSSKFSSIYEPCSLNYYDQAVKKLASKITNPVFFVFSDDIEWSKKNLKIPHPVTFVSNPEIKDYEELILISLCRHNIMANSTFSWWGAWLNQNPHKIVLAPKQWFKIKNLKYDDSDIYPASWQKI
jgi:hypothetical protein